jgi:hypothetical protein
MVKFEFTLTDEEAESLMFAVNYQISNLRVHIIEEMAGKDRSKFINHYRDSIEFYKELKSKMKNTRVKD